MRRKNNDANSSSSSWYVDGHPPTKAPQQQEEEEDRLRLSDPNFTLLLLLLRFEAPYNIPLPSFFRFLYFYLRAVGCPPPGKKKRRRSWTSRGEQERRKKNIISPSGLSKKLKDGKIKIKIILTKDDFFVVVQKKKFPRNKGMMQWVVVVVTLWIAHIFFQLAKY